MPAADGRRSAAPRSRSCRRSPRAPPIHHAQSSARFAKPALRVSSPASDAELAAIPGIAAVRHHNDDRLAELAAGAVPAEVIRVLAGRLPVEGIEPYQASLEDIFLRAVEDDHVAVV